MRGIIIAASPAGPDVRPRGLQPSHYPPALEWFLTFCAMMSVALVAIAVMLLLMMARGCAEWKPEYAASSPATQDWYRNAELTKAAQERFPFKKCCDRSDVVKTKFEVDRTSGRDVWLYEDRSGHMRRIPDDIIHWGQSAPDGQPTLFVYAGQETCFFPGDGGI